MVKKKSSADSFIKKSIVVGTKQIKKRGQIKKIETVQSDATSRLIKSRSLKVK